MALQGELAPEHPGVDRHWRMLIGGRLVDAAGGEQADVVDPARGAIVARIPSGSSADVATAVDAAARTFPTWRATSASDRAGMVCELAAAIEQHGEELAWLDTVDGGSPIKVMRGDYKLAVDQLRYFAGLALELRGETIPTHEPGTLDFTLREPFGVVGRIVPFNHPLMFAASRIAAPLVAGNTVVLKPSEHTSLSALRLGELAAGVLPPGVLNVVTGVGAVVGDAIVRHPGVPRIAFTGGVEVGRQIQRSAAEASVKTVTLELGGKNPMIVLPDANVDDAVAGAVRGMNFTWQGQSCGSTSRLYVHRSLLEGFISAVADRMEDLVIGDPQDEGTDVGAIAYRAQYDKVVRYLEAAGRDPRSRLVTGGLPPAGEFGDGLFVRPTLFALEHDADSPIATEEIFGPILVAMPFDTLDEVIGRANALPFGLTASVWTNDLSTAMRASRELAAGYVWVNWSSSHIPGTPFGGVKDSGVGREEGIEELYGYTQSKNVYVKY
jgi:acyl-CoA reductase-like NAD-dependent aldehyde dehydrogenase